MSRIVSNSPFFSIILPTFNRSELIISSVNSVLQQQFSDYELIIIDDGSTDNTSEILENKYQEYFKNGIFKLIRNETNSGVSACRNIGLEHANGKWIAYLDSDNTLDSQFLLEFYKTIEKNRGIQCAYAQFKRLSDNRLGASHAFNFDELCYENYIDLGVFVHSKELYTKFGGFDSKLKRLVDWDLIIRYTKENTPIYLDKVLMTYNNLERDDRISNKTNNLPVAYNRVMTNNGIERTKITTIIVSYNHEKFIEKALLSAINQFSHSVYEIIVSDDGSTDNTHKIITKYVEKYPDLIKDLSSTINVGVSENYRRCISKASGDYIAILEGDDYWNGGKIETQRLFLENNPDCSMVFSRLLTLNQSTGKLVVDSSQGVINTKKLDFNDFYKFSSLNPIKNFSCCMFKADLLKTMPKELYEKRLSEIPLCAYLSQFGKLGYIERPLSVYRYHENGVWSGMTQEKRMCSSYEIRLLTKRLLNEKQVEQFDRYLLNEYYSRQEFIEYAQANDQEAFSIIQTKILNFTCKTNTTPTSAIVGIFVIHNHLGVVEDYVLYMLDSITPQCKKLIIIVLGSLKLDSFNILSKYTDCIIRFHADINKIKAESIVFRKYLNELTDYSRVLIFDDEIYGPVGSISSLFDMKIKDSDLVFGLIEPSSTDYRKIIINSSFQYLSKKFFKSKTMSEYWSDANIAFVNRFESNALRVLEGTWNVKALSDYRNLAVNNKCNYVSSNYLPEQLYNDSLVFIPKRIFSMDKASIIKHSDGCGYNYLFNKIVDKYPIYMIWSDLIRRYNITDLKNILNLNYVLPTGTLVDHTCKKTNSCAIVHLHYMDKLDESLSYLYSLSNVVDLYITTSSVENIPIIESLLHNSHVNYCEIRASKNRGREQSALLIECRDLFYKYDYLCFIHDKKSLTSNTLNYVSSDTYQGMLFKNLAASEMFIKNVISLFEANKQLGLLSPPAPLHSIYSSSIGLGWTSSFSEMKKLKEQFCLNTVIDDNKSPFCLGTAFWCRTDSLKKLYEHDWKYEDFPEEPLKSDGTMMHAIERCFPYFAQDAGFYSAWILSDQYSSAYLQNLFYIDEELMKVFRKVTGTRGTFDSMESKIKQNEQVVIQSNIFIEELLKKVKPNLLLRESPLFDTYLYHKLYYPFSDCNMSCIDHYLTIGWKKGYYPSRRFDTEAYLTANKDVKEARVNPLIHYLLYGQHRKGVLVPKFDDYYLIKSSLLFSDSWYLEKYGQEMKYKDPVEDYIKEGWIKGYIPSPYFDSKDYLDRYADVRSAKIDPLFHYLKYGLNEKKAAKKVEGTTDYDLVKYSGLFDSAYYKQVSGIDGEELIGHYLSGGWKYNNPSRFFDEKDYLNRYSDVKKSGVCPLIHYITHGYYEKRKINEVEDNQEVASISLRKDKPKRKRLSFKLFGHK